MKKPEDRTSHTSLLNENDRTVAFVIAYTPIRTGAEILARLTPERQSEIVRRLVEFQPEDVPTWAEGEWLERIKNGIDCAVKLLGRLDRAVWQTILDDISQGGGHELAGCIRQRMWLFDDIAQLHDLDVTSILKNVETSQLVIALQGASEELRAKINKNISKRAAKMLQEEIEYHSSCKQSDIENVRCEIVYIMQRLEDSGEIRKPKSDISRPAGSDETGEKILLAIAEKIDKESFEMYFGDDTTCRSDEYIVVFTARYSFWADQIRREFSHDIDEAILAVLGIKKPYDFLGSSYY